MANVVILPGSGCAPTMQCNYYAWLKSALVERNIVRDVRVTTPAMPDPHLCRQKIWIPHCEDVLKCDEESIVVGHSSGAVCALRLAERRRLRAIVLVAGYDDDLGDANERASGFFDSAFDYEKIKENCSGRIDCVIGLRDGLVPAEMQRELASKLGVREPTICEKRDHFFTPPAEEIIESIKRFV